MYLHLLRHPGGPHQAVRPVWIREDPPPAPRRLRSASDHHHHLPYPFNATRYFTIWELQTHMQEGDAVSGVCCFWSFTWKRQTSFCLCRMTTFTACCRLCLSGCSASTCSCWSSASLWSSASSPPSCWRTSLANRKTRSP